MKGQVDPGCQTTNEGQEKIRVKFECHRMARQEIQAGTEIYKSPNEVDQGVESPMPLGFANGVGNGLPHNAEMRCGMLLQKRTPAKNREKCIKLPFENGFIDT